jgi:ABC-type transport system involved in multi-copper enzyme maturation permease subunit
VAEAAFDDVTLGDGWSAGGWRVDAVGGDDLGASAFQQSGSEFALSGTGDIAPKTNDPGAVERSLIGVFAGLIVVVVVGALFVTAEYRRGVIRTTFTATPRRGRVLAAKALVLGGVTFAVGLVAALVALWLVGALRRSHGDPHMPVPTSTEVRLVVGTALLLALAAILALAVGAILRRSGGAVAVSILLVVLPYLLAVASAVPLVVARWLLRVTPAAGFAVQQSVPEYDHVIGDYTPPNGYFPLPWWGGLGVLVLWTVAAVALATVLVRRRDV